MNSSLIVQYHNDFGEEMHDVDRYKESRGYIIMARSKEVEGESFLLVRGMKFKC